MKTTLMLALLAALLGCIYCQNTYVTDNYAEKAVYRYNCGGDEYTDSRGKKWMQDANFDTGNIDRFNHPFLNGAYDPTIYHTERWAPNGFKYTLPIDNGKYRVRIYNAELYQGIFRLWDQTQPTQALYGQGNRVFKVTANGQEKLSKVDVFEHCGAWMGCHREFDVEVSSGTLEIGFVPIREAPMCNGLEVIKLEDVVPDQQLPANRKQGFLSYYYNFIEMPAPLMTMPPFDSRKPIFSQVERFMHAEHQPTPFKESPYRIQFGTIFRGYLRAPVTGEYTILMESNDGSIMYLDDMSRKFIDNDGNHWAHNGTGRVTMQAGSFHPFEIHYFQGLILAGLKLFWTFPGQPTTVINPEFFSYDETTTANTPVVNVAVNGDAGLPQPIKGAAGSRITITGSGLKESTLMIDGTAVPATSHGDFKMSFNMPASTTNEAKIKVKSSTGVESNELTFIFEGAAVTPVTQSSDGVPANDRPISDISGEPEPEPQASTGVITPGSSKTPVTPAKSTGTKPTPQKSQAIVPNPNVNGVNLMQVSFAVLASLLVIYAL